MTELLPTFETARLVLRPWTLADRDASLAMDRDILATRFIPGLQHYPIAHRVFIEAHIHDASPSGMGAWSIFLASGFIGWVFLAPENWRNPLIEMGWYLTQPAWGKSFAAEAAKPVLQYALNTLALKRVVADIDPANLASLKVGTKLGFRPTGGIQHGDWTMTRGMVEVT